MTVGDVLGAYLDHLRSLGRAVATIQAAAWDLTGFGRFLHLRGTPDLRAIGRHDIDAYIIELDRRYSLSTRTRRLYTIKRLFEYFIEENRLLHNPVEHIRQPHVRHAMGRVLDLGEMQKLIAAIDTGQHLGIRDRALIELLWATGMRRAEVTSLSLKDVSIEAKVARVEHGKGNRQRMVPLTSEACRWVGEYVSKVRPWLVAKNRGAEDRLFLSRRGGPLSLVGMGKIFEKLGRNAGLPKVSCHALRRTMATGLLSGGADVRLVSELLGHRFLETTASYTKVVLADLKREQERTHPRGGLGA